MTDLFTAYQTHNIVEFENVFKRNQTTLLTDPFIREHIEDLVKYVRTKVLLTIIKPYKVIRLTFVSKELNISEWDAENLVVSCILDGIIKGRIDQVNGVLKKNLENRTGSEARFASIEKYAESIESVHQAIFDASFKQFR